ncbi:SRPBCC domain-containing protein [Ilumatobacter sp.]|uniref:SRPBCC domain-containing protein n=1 Tax=Ilumatobacter sp. TaxID=1967498 RepID=UPI003C4E17D4
MTEHTIPSDLSTLDARRGSARIELSPDGSSYECVRVFGAGPERIFRAFTDPDDLRVWFPSGAPPGSEMTVCESDPVEDGRYHYAMMIPEFGPMAWYGTYTGVDRPNRLDANEWFVMGESDPTGPPTSQTLTFEPTGDGFTLMTMRVDMPEPEDPETFMEQSAAGLTSSLAAMDELVSS